MTNFHTRQYGLPRYQVLLHCPLTPFLFLRFSSESHNSLLPVNYGGQGQCFHTFTWKNSDKHSTKWHWHHFWAHHCRRGLAYALLYAFAHGKATSLSVSTHSSQDQCFGSVRWSAPVFLRGRNRRRIQNMPNLTVLQYKKGRLENRLVVLITI